MLYTITDSPTGRLWWATGETIPPMHTIVRAATEDEAILMQRISRHRNPPVAWGDKIARLIARDLS